MSWKNNRPDGWKNPYMSEDAYFGQVYPSTKSEIYEAGADAMHKADVEWLMQFRHDCIECGWTITPDHEDWQKFIEGIE